MISKLRIQNFRSLKNVDLDLGKITILTGANNSGKSSIIYSLLTLRNAIVYPNRKIDNLFNYNFINLGNYKDVVFNNSDNLDIQIMFDITGQEIDLSYGIQLSLKDNNNITFQSRKPLIFKATLPVLYPHSFNSYIPVDDDSLGLKWNGIEFLFSKNINISSLDLPVVIMYSIDEIPVNRGFTKPLFGMVPLQDLLTTEDEIATSIATDEALSSEISYYLEKIINKQFYSSRTENTALFRLKTLQNGIARNLVNEGTGTNQLIAILAKVLQSNSSIICIDEPEIHLHPSIIKKLLVCIIDIADKHGKQFIISTHSETLVLSLLDLIENKEFDYKNGKVYFFKNQNGSTIIENQKLNEFGQIEGGLKNFYIDELSDIERLTKML